jgi:transposase
MERRPLGGEGASRAGRRKRRPVPQPYPVEIRLKAVKLHLEEGMPLQLISQELGASPESLRAWVQRYQKLGRAGLELVPRGLGRRAKSKLPPAVKAKIVEIKQQQPAFGTRRIAQWLRRVLFLPASPETVRRTLHQHQLLPKTRPKRPPKNPPKPRFFERATPNQMWQSDKALPCPRN